MNAPCQNLGAISPSTLIENTTRQSYWRHLVWPWQKLHMCKMKIQKTEKMVTYWGFIHTLDERIGQPQAQGRKHKRNHIQFLARVNPLGVHRLHYTGKKPLVFIHGWILSQPSSRRKRRGKEKKETLNNKHTQLWKAKRKAVRVAKSFVFAAHGSAWCNARRNGHVVQQVPRVYAADCLWARVAQRDEIRCLAHGIEALVVADLVDRRRKGPVLSIVVAIVFLDKERHHVVIREKMWFLCCNGNWLFAEKLLSQGKSAQLHIFEHVCLCPNGLRMRYKKIQCVCNLLTLSALDPVLGCYDWRRAFEEYWLWTERRFVVPRWGFPVWKCRCECFFRQVFCAKPGQLCFWKA